MKEILVISLTEEEMKEILYSTVKGLLDDFKEELKLERQIELLTRKEVAKLLKISLPTLHEWSKTGKLKVYRKSGRVYYKRHEVMVALDERSTYSL